MIFPAFRYFGGLCGITGEVDDKDGALDTGFDLCY